jgi:hypothetical protein
METEKISSPSTAEMPHPACVERIQSLQSKITGFYRGHEKYSGLAIFGIGFLWDSLTMTRVDNMIDNVILLFYLVLIAFMILFTLRRQCGRIAPKWIQKYEPYFVNAMQFCFGGLFSSYVIFYFKSASWTRTQFFFLILVFLWIANEFLHHRLENPELLAILYSFCLLSFLAFFLPVVMVAVNERIFLLAGSLSLAISLSVFFAGLLFPSEGRLRRLASIAAWIGSVVLAVNILYFLNLIPPVPLALKSAGIYHEVLKTPEGYRVKYVAPSPFRFWKKCDSPFFLSPGERVYCYTAVFAPGKVRVPVLHVWSRKTPAGWVQTDRIKFAIAGGREGGYRGYTAKYGITPGSWRVAVETMRGQTLGQINFDVVASPDPHPPLQTRLIR